MATPLDFACGLMDPVREMADVLQKAVYATVLQVLTEWRRPRLQKRGADSGAIAELKATTGRRKRVRRWRERGMSLALGQEKVD